MFDLGLWLQAWPALAAIAIGGWLLSLWRRDVSHVDVLWALMFIASAYSYYFGGAAGADGQGGSRALLALALVSIWGVRLAAYIAWRAHGQPEDRRYQAIRARNQPGFAFKSLYIVFVLQAALAWIISLPLVAAVNSTTALGWLDYLGVTLWLIGFVFEAGGDWQLARFKAQPGNQGEVMDRGFWRYTRHPNYFGDFCVWWGFFLIALSGGGWWSAISVLLMSFLLLRVSGVVLLERDIGERRPAYKEYVECTNSFFPAPPRSNH